MPIRSLRLVLLATFCMFFWVGCSNSQSNRAFSRAPENYCAYLPSKSFESSVVVKGQAIYEFRVNGNGPATDSGAVINIDSFTSASRRTYSLTVGGRTYSVESDLGGAAAQQDVVAKLKQAILQYSSNGIYAYGSNQLIVTDSSTLATPLIANMINMSADNSHLPPRPIRFAEVAVKNSQGDIVQCAETDENGAYQFQLPMNSGRHSIEVRSRAANRRSSAFVLNNPEDNVFHFVQVAISATGDGEILAPLARAKVRDDLLGGAFNILDQLLAAQDYLRSETASCDQPGHINYFLGCAPFTTAPRVTAYWTAGLSPSVYLGSTGSISFYLNGRRELYIQGGQNGNVVSSDMDHFDNSVILHEYAHFLEDMYGRPNSPGGVHNGDSIIDPRLAWGEGWANFFQAAVTQNPVYRDTYGSPDCHSLCAGTFFNESIDPSGTPNNDAPTEGALGEGNFREFSVTRMLWDVIKPAGGVGRFSEIWRAIVVPGSGLREVNDPFKTVGRFHHIQSSLSSAQSWSMIRSIEEQVSGFSVYATPFRVTGTACATSPTTISPVRRPGDTGSFATSDQFRNNDFYRFDHSGGPVLFELFYSKNQTNPPDLDFYLYNSKYVFGRASDMNLTSAFSGDGCPTFGSGLDSANPFRGQNGCPVPPTGLPSTFGYERSGASLPPGTYMLNIQADTSVQPGSPADYVIILNGERVCPEL